MVNHRPVHPVAYSFFSADEKAVIEEIGKDRLLGILQKMMLIRHFEIRGESAYQHGKLGGFYHSYMGQEAIQCSAVAVMGQNNWWMTTYRCHALALLLGTTPRELMAELYGKETGNAKGRGGSMHFFTDRLLGGLAIVGGHVPVATGAAFSLKYQGIKDQIAICFLGDGAMPQGAVHEAFNIASLWSLPILFVIENNQWGMGTHFQRANAVDRLAEDIAPSYNMKGYTFQGMNFFQCYAGFSHVYKEVIETGRPVLVEAISERFRGHSISDPGLYRSKEDLKKCMKEDPILYVQETLLQRKMITEEEIKTMDKEAKEVVLDAMQFAEESPWPNPVSLEEGVFSERDA